MNRRDVLKGTTLLMGYAVSGATLSSIFTSCQSHPDLDWEPKFFSKEQANIISEMAEGILPKTDTPGAKDLKLGQFVDEMVKQVMKEEDQQAMKDGVDQFNEDCKEAMGKDFVSLSQEEKEKFLLDYDRQAPTQIPVIWGWPTEPPRDEKFSFYRNFKDLVMTGYFTSEAVGKNILSYDPIPGGYQPCIPLSEVGNIWTEG